VSDDVYANRRPDFYNSYLDRYSTLGKGPVLDMGAGHGLFLQAALARGIRGAGVELILERVEACQEVGLDVKQHDLADPLPFEDESFEAIYCGQVIEHVPHETKEMIFAEAYRVLKPGGEFQVCSPCRHHEPARLQPGHDYMLTPSELHTMLEQYGFETIDMGFNHPQEVPEIPPDLLRYIWKTYKPDLLAVSATAMCRKAR
jgi:SAM-dependent methyltransferase